MGAGGHRLWEHGQRTSPAALSSKHLPGWLKMGLEQCDAGPMPALPVEDSSAVQNKLCRRIEKHIKELFVFVAEPEAPSDNNAAERSLRHLVTSRKI